MGLWGYVVAIYVTETLNTTLSLCRMLPMSRMPVSLWRQVFGPLLCITGATAICRMGGALLRLSIHGRLDVALHIAVCGGIYVGLLVLTGVMKIPHGHGDKSETESKTTPTRIRKES
jgi:hypothetical protein